MVEFAEELELMVKKSTLEALREVLQDARRGRQSRTRAKPAATTRSDGLPAKIAAHVEASPGQTVGEIVKAVGANAAAVKQAIKAMLVPQHLEAAPEPAIAVAE